MARQINFAGYLIKQFGAYIRTDLSGLVDINGVGSGVIGMVGLAEKGPVNTPVTINGYTELVRTFGDGPLVRHGLAAYVGGASTMVCIRIGDPQRARASVYTVGSGGGSTTPTDVYEWVAKEQGTMGNNISISVADTDAGTPSDPDDDTFTLKIHFIDDHGNDVRETFILPKFIPNPAGRFYANNTNDYYFLRDRYTGVIRDIPESWGYGNTFATDFLDKIDNLKSTDEDLFGPFPYDGGVNIFPLPIIASILNNGGLGYAPSGLVTLGQIDPEIGDILLPGFVYDPNNADTFQTHPSIRLAGGTNGDDGTNFYGFASGSHPTDPDTIDDYNTTYDRLSFSTVMQDSWGAALSLMEDEDVNFIQPAYLFNFKPGSNTNEWEKRVGFFGTMVPLFLAHTNTMSNVPNRRYRTTVFGLPYYRKGMTTGNNTAQDFLDDQYVRNMSGLLNNDRTQLWAGGFQSRAFSSSVEEYGGDMLASFVVGAHAAREVSVTLTFAQLAGIFTDGMEFQWNQAQKDELYTRGFAFAMKRRNSAGAVEYVAAHNYTTFTGASNQGIQLFLTRRIVDYVSTFLYKNLEENFIGQKSLGSRTEGEIANFVTALLNKLVSDGILVDFANVQVAAEPNDKTVYNVFYDFQPVSEIDFITVTQRLIYSLA